MRAQYHRFFIMKHTLEGIMNSMNDSKTNLPTSFLDDLKHNICQVNFTKKDGTVRKMLCTLSPEILQEQKLDEQSQTRKSNPDVISVWDLENSGWRSFRKDSVVDFSVGFFV